MNSLTLGSLFSGSGGFELAGALFGIEPLWESEVEPLPIRVTERNFPNCLKLGNIVTIHGWSIPKVDIITGGSPCQDMSIAGKRDGLSGDRSCLFKKELKKGGETRAGICKERVFCLGGNDLHWTAAVHVFGDRCYCSRSSQGIQGMEEIAWRK